MGKCDIGSGGGSEEKMEEKSKTEMPDQCEKVPRGW